MKLTIAGEEITGSGLIGEVRTDTGLPDAHLVEEVLAIMEKYRINHMWFAWDRWALEKQQLKKSGRKSLRKR